MTHDHSPRSGAVAPVVNPSSQAAVASLAVVVLTPLLAMVVYTHPLLGLGALAGVLARPAVDVGRLVVDRLVHFADGRWNRRRVSASGVRVDAGAE